MQGEQSEEKSSGWSTWKTKQVRGWQQDESVSRNPGSVFHRGPLMDIKPSVGSDSSSSTTEPV